MFFIIQKRHGESPAFFGGHRPQGELRALLFHDLFHRFLIFLGVLHNGGHHGIHCLFTTTKDTGNPVAAVAHGEGHRQALHRVEGAGGGPGPGACLILAGQQGFLALGVGGNHRHTGKALCVILVKLHRKGEYRVVGVPAVVEGLALVICRHHLRHVFHGVQVGGRVGRVDHGDGGKVDVVCVVSHPGHIGERLRSLSGDFGLQIVDLELIPGL